MAGRRTWTGEEKLSVVLELVKGQETVTSLCQRHGVAVSQVYRWREAFLERGKVGLRDQRNPKHRDPVKEEVRALRDADVHHRIDAALALERVPDRETVTALRQAARTERPPLVQTILKQVLKQVAR